MQLPNGNILLRTGSHRARENLAELFERKINYWWTMELGGCLAEVTPEEYKRFAVLKRTQRTYWHGSITRASRLKSGPLPCLDVAWMQA